MIAKVTKANYFDTKQPIIHYTKLKLNIYHNRIKAFPRTSWITYDIFLLHLFTIKSYCHEY